MSAQQLAEGDKRYEKLAAGVTSKEDMRAEAREEDIGRYSATIHLQRPACARRHEHRAAPRIHQGNPGRRLDNDQIESRGQVTLYMMMTRSAQLKGATSDVLDNHSCWQSCRTKSCP